MSVNQHAPARPCSTKLLQRWLLAALFLGSTHLFAAAENAAKTGTAPPAIAEMQLNQVTLSFEAIKKLGITTSKVTLANRQPYKSYPAEVGLPPSGLTTYTTPMSGYILTSQPQSLQIGTKVKTGQRLFSIIPIVTPETRLSLITSLADAEGQLQTAEKQIAAHKLTLNRTTQLQTQHVGSQKAVDEAQANVAIADTNLNAILQKRDLLKQAVEQGSTGSYPVIAASSGIISNVYFTPGQLLVAGTKLVDIVNQEALWVTVAVPHEQLNTLNLRAEAWLSQASASNLAGYALIPVPTAPEGDALTGTRKLVYILKAKGDIAPMQRLTVQLPLRDATRPHMSVPCSATVVDIYGNTWVYLQLDATQFSRQPVFITQSGAHGCLLSDQRLAGKKVVTRGAQELFAIETGYTH